MQLHIMSGIPHKVSATVSAMEINFMDMFENPIKISAETVQHPEFNEPCTKLTLSAPVGDSELAHTLYAPPAAEGDNIVLLFSLMMGPSDHFILKVMTPFIETLCAALGRPMIRVIKPEFQPE